MKRPHSAKSVGTTDSGFGRRAAVGWRDGYTTLTVPPNVLGWPQRAEIHGDGLVVRSPERDRRRVGVVSRHGGVRRDHARIRSARVERGPAQPADEKQQKGGSRQVDRPPLPMEPLVHHPNLRPMLEESLGLSRRTIPRFARPSFDAAADGCFLSRRSSAPSRRPRPRMVGFSSRCHLCTRSGSCTSPRVLPPPVPQGTRSRIVGNIRVRRRSIAERWHPADEPGFCERRRCCPHDWSRRRPSRSAASRATAAHRAGVSKTIDAH